MTSLMVTSRYNPAKRALLEVTCGSYLLLLIFVLLFLTDKPYADLPPAGLVMLDLASPRQLSSKAHESAATTLTFEELVAAGINGVHYRPTTEISPIYSYAEWVNEAHEYGLWVCAEIQREVNKIDMAGQAASQGVDFIQLDHPLKGWEWGCSEYNDSFDETVLKRIENMVAQSCVHDSCPVVITDVDCDSIYVKWQTLDGLLQQVFSNSWLSKYFPRILTYKNTHPEKFSGAWVFLNTYNYFDSVAVPDGDFENWFSEVYTKTGNVVMYDWKTREEANWASRAEIIKRVTGKSGAIPEWDSFNPALAIAQSAPDCQVRVRCPVNGLDPGSVECFYAVDSIVSHNTKWIKHDNVSTTGIKGAKDWITITANRVPFNPASSVNKIRFKITNTYNGNFFRGPQTFKRDFAVMVDKPDWSELIDNGTVKTLPADISLSIQHTAGLDVSSVKSEYSVDGGITWQEHPAVCTGTAGSTQKETVSVNGIPFINDKARKNKIRFSIRTSGNEELKSAEYPVSVMLAPVFKEMRSVRIEDSNINLSLKIGSSEGLRVGRRNWTILEETIGLFHLDGDLTEASANGFAGSLFGDAKFLETDSWKSSGGTEKALYLDGDGDYVDFGFHSLGASSELSVSFWVKPESDGLPVSMGGVEQKGSLLFNCITDSVIVSGLNMNRDLMSDVISTGKIIRDGNWHQISFTFNGISAKLFIDGEVAVESDWTGYSLFELSPFRLGKAGDRPECFKGYIDEVHIINRALTESEIAATYYSGVYRYSSNGGGSWSGWNTLLTANKDGSKGDIPVYILKMPLPANTDSLNRIQLAAKDVSGNAGAADYVFLAEDVVPVQTEIARITKVEVYPNPFFYKTKIMFTLDTPQRISVNILDVKGNAIKVMDDKRCIAGRNIIIWNGRDAKGNQVTAGQYFARIVYGGQVMVKKLLLLH
ncbi:MAG: hypothetical protein HQK83_17855 [Fibrobacteria bacterium]|nr:hypothetical protein [Fibrobacteria bacterium]